MDASAVAASLKKIPYTAGLGIIIDHADSAEVQMTLPDASISQNMLGIVHAGALYTFAETVAGVAAGFDHLDVAFPLARKAEIHYLRPARGAIHAHAKIDAADSTRVAEELERDGRSELSVAVQLSDSSGQIVAEAAVDYAFRSMQKQ